MDEHNGDHLKRELFAHRESRTGDVVLLNMLHGTHFMASSIDYFDVGKTWGPWLWYLNNGSTKYAANRAKQDESSWPYTWFNSSTYQNRGIVSGTLILSDGRPASNAAVFLGDNHPNETTLDMGRYNYCATYADSNGTFRFDNVRTGVYALQAWTNGAPIGDVSTIYLLNDEVQVQDRIETTLYNLTWTTQNMKAIWRIGNMDRKSLGFQYSGAPRQHALVEKCPANLTFVPGLSRKMDWCFAQSALRTWTVAFNLSSADIPKNSSVVLSVSLAGYSGGISSEILVNGVMVGNLTRGSIPADPYWYRSAATAGEWHYFEFGVGNGTLKGGGNEVSFVVTKNTRWSGYMWDAILLEWSA